jgi:hypothetical protein
MAIPLAVLTPLKGVHATPGQIASLLELQLLAILPMGALFSATGPLRRRFGLAAGGMLVVPVFAVGVVLSTFELRDRAQLALVAVALLIAIAASYVWTDRIAVTAAGWLSDRSQARPSWDWRSRPKGWAALGPYALGAVVLAVAATLAIDYSMVRMVGPSIPDNARRVLPSQMLMTVVLLSAIGGQAAPYALRALRVLPPGPAALTAVLQGFLLAILLAPLGVLWAVMRASDMETSKVPVYFAGMIPIVALRLPVNFRVGVQPGAFLAILPAVGLIFLPLAPWTSSLWFDAAMILTAAMIWIWTWWELAFARAAYRVQALGLTRWRGGLN